MMSNSYDYYERTSRQRRPYARQVRQDAYADRGYDGRARQVRKVKEDLILKSFGILDFVWGMIVLFGVVVYFIMSAGSTVLEGPEVFACIICILASVLCIYAGLLSYRTRSRRRNSMRMASSFLAFAVSVFTLILFAAQENSKWIYGLLGCVFSILIYLECRKLAFGTVRGQ